MHLSQKLAYAPLFPVALTGTLGILVDRVYPLATPTGWFIALGMLMGWYVARKKNPLLAEIFLWLVWFGLGVGYHHSWRSDFPKTDLGNYATEEAKLVQVRGLLRDEFISRLPVAANPLRSRPVDVRSLTTIEAEEILIDGMWVPCSGIARLSVEGVPEGIRSGDRIEILGWLNLPYAPHNPGERDTPSQLLDDRIRCELRVRKSPNGVVRLEAGDVSLNRTLAQVRGYANRVIDSELKSQSGLGGALLLGENQGLASDEWQKYVRTGVIHVLAISGQHLVILGAFIWGVLRVLGVPYRYTALIVALLLLGYALLTGGRPSAMRAAVMVCAFCGSIWFGRRVMPLNTFCLAWIVVLALKPTDLFMSGFQLSFLCVAVLIWGIPRLVPNQEPEGVEKLLEESRTPLERLLRGVWSTIWKSYLITLILGLTTIPLVGYWQNLVSPVGVLIGPIMILLTTLALLSGFCLLLLSPLGILNGLLGTITQLLLNLCEIVVGWADGTPGGCWWTGPIPGWWVLVFYSVGFAWIVLLQPINENLCVGRLANRSFIPRILLAWVVIGLGIGLYRPSVDELRVTVLSVGHGSCAVVETPDGRVFLFDAGADSGPETAARVVAPYLWSRGIRRIDEVFLSHADLDHFNTLPELSARFRIGRVTYNPTFPEKPTAGVQFVIQVLEERGIETRAAFAGQKFAAGEVTFTILHPPLEEIIGEENARSLVILLEHRGHKILFTGDLEKAGLTRVTTLASPKPDILIVPHHGSAAANTEAFVRWASPRFAISSQAGRDSLNAEANYKSSNIPYWDTGRYGAITIRSHPSGLTSESFLRSQRQVVRSGSGEEK